MALRNDRKWEIIIYPDSSSYSCDDVLLAAQKSFKHWAYILHDKDTNEDGTPKKPHYHFYGKYDIVRTPEFVSYCLNVPTSSLANVSKWKSAIRYLCHLDHPDKFQYPIESVVSNFALGSYVNENNDDLMAQRIYEHIKDCNFNITMAELTDWVFQNNLWSAFRRGFAVWSKFIISSGGNQNESSRYSSR